MVLTRSLGRTRAYLCDPALIHEVLVRNADQLTKSLEMKRVLGTALGDGLLTADGAAWRWQRQALAPAFQHDKLARMIPAMIAAAEATRDRLLTLPDGAVVDIGHEMMHTTFAIILETMLSGSEGIDAAKVERGVSDFLSATSWMFALAILRAPRWLPFPGRARAATATRFMRRTIAAKIALRRGAGAADLLGMLLNASDPETGHAMADANVADNTLTFVAAGHETTAVALGWTLALLSDHPDCLARLVAEIEQVTGDGPVRPSHVADLAYARQVVSEAMRLYPPAPPHRARRTERDDHRGGDACRRIGGLRAHPCRPSPPRSLGAAGRLRSGPVRAGPGARTPPLRLSAVRRRSTHLHRQRVRHDGGGGDPRRTGQGAALRACRHDATVTHARDAAARPAAAHARRARRRTAFLKPPRGRATSARKRSRVRR